MYPRLLIHVNQIDVASPQWPPVLTDIHPGSSILPDFSAPTGH
jgi:hypothetical protein